MVRPRFSLRWKIALLASGLLLVGVAVLATITVYKPWLAKLANQRHLALERVRPLSPIIVRRSAQGTSFRPEVMRDLVLNSAATPGQELLYALLYDGKGQLIESASVANTELLGKLAPRLLALYRIDPAGALAQLARRRAHVQRLGVTLKLEGNPAPVGKMTLGLVTSTIDADASSGLIAELEALAALLLLGVLGAFLMARRLARPLVDLSSAMGRAEKGEFDVGLEVQSRTRDEIGDLARSFNSMLHGLRERERLRGTLGRYVSGDVAERILSERDDLSLQGETRNITVLFLDVRGFTSLSELLTPQELVALLNDYFQVMVDAVQRGGGVVNKFIGDAALCLWGAPRTVATPELSAVRAAIEIQTGAGALSQSRIARGLPTVEFGIGINAGEALAGNLGAAQRLEYTVIGDAVNLAQRLEAQAKAGEVLVSQSVFEKVEHQVDFAVREPVRVKGKSEPVPLWEVRALKLGAALLLLFGLFGSLACEREQGGASDELTITVSGDKHEFELQEKELAQREHDLSAEKSKLDGRLDELLKTVGTTDADQRKRADDELSQVRQRENDLAAREQSMLAEKSQIDARRAAFEPPLIAAGASGADLPARERELAVRETRDGEREADLARREKELAAREAADAQTELSLANSAKAAAATLVTGPRDIPQASAIDARHKKLLEELDARGVLIADLPVEDQPLNSDIWSARRQGDFSHASDLLAELSRSMKQLKVDQKFVEGKMVRLQKQRANATLNDAQRNDVEGLLRDVTAAYSDGKYDAANRGLNRIARILDASSSPG